MTDSLQEENGKKLLELLPWTHYAVGCFLEDCFSHGKKFKVLEVFRTQERQNKLYAQGRTAPGARVTWTLQSDHTERLAFDIEPINCFHRDIAAIGWKYGIEHPFPLDPPHYSCRHAVEEPPYVPTLSPQEKVKTLLRAIGRSTGALKDMLLRQYYRLISRFH